jgi:hypothetical protein
VETKHTPGPWGAEPSPLDARYQIWGARDNGERVLIGYVYGSSDINPAHVILPEENARLIAASPKMYDYINEKAKSGDEDAQKIINSI